MKRYLAIAALAAVIVPMASAADVWFGRIYGGIHPMDRPAISIEDHVQGQIPVVGPKGFHPVSPLSDAFKLTDGSTAGVVMADFGAHWATTITFEDTAGNFTPSVVERIRSFGGNPDTRNWQNLVVEWKNSSGVWTRFFATSPSFGHMYATITDGNGDPRWGENIAVEYPSATESMIEIYNSDGDLLAGGAVIHGLRFSYWLVSSWGSQILPGKEEFDLGFQPTPPVPGQHPGYADVTGSIIQEIDVFVPEPSAALLLITGVLALTRRR